MIRLIKSTMETTRGVNPLGSPHKANVIEGAAIEIIHEAYEEFGQAIFHGRFLSW